MIVSFFHGSAWSEPYGKDTEWSVAAIHSFRGYMEQMIFDSSHLLRPASFMEDAKGSLFNHSNIIHPFLEVVQLFLL